MITQDDEDDDIKKVVTMAPVYRKKTFETQKVVNNTDNKAGLNLFKQRTITKVNLEKIFIQSFHRVQFYQQKIIQRISISLIINSIKTF